MGEKKKDNKSSSSTQTVWFSLKKSLHCRSDASDVHNPKTRTQLTSVLTKARTAPRSGCSRSLANLKDVIHGSKRHLTSVERPTSSCSPRSIGSSEFLNPIAHQVILSNSKCELKITGFNGCFHDEAGGDNSVNGGMNTVSSYVMGNLKPGTPMHCFSNPSFNSTTPPRKCNKNAIFRERNELSLENKGSITNGVRCHKCGEQFVKWEAFESHHLSKHAVTELVEGDSSRKVVEIICRSSHHLKSDQHHHSVKIDRVLKVHNTPKTLARFEEHREAVKIRASKLPNKKHPRCLADGNELLRFYGTTLSCSLGLNCSASLCVSDKCCVCRIIRHGFSIKREFKNGVGVFTTSTSGRAYESIESYEEDGCVKRKALVLCRVIAGRVHRPLERIEDVVRQDGFDSLAGKVGLHSNIEELYLLDTKALLPCFVVICRS